MIRAIADGTAPANAGCVRDHRIRRLHFVQRAVGRIVAPLWVPLVVCTLRFVMRYQVEDIAALRERYQRYRAESPGPVLICANHLTMIDSALIAYALAPGWRYSFHFDELPWNTPERRNFANRFWNRIPAYLAKCIPITRGGPREEVALVLARVTHALRRGETALIFPEGGRSRSGRVEPESAAWGVGRIVGALPGCRVLCVYLRGHSQESYSKAPARGERFHASLACFEPKSDARGPRRSLDFAKQIVAKLVEMERSYFDGRQ